MTQHEVNEISARYRETIREINVNSCCRALMGYIPAEGRMAMIVRHKKYDQDVEYPNTSDTSKYPWNMLKEARMFEGMIGSVDWLKINTSHVDHVESYMNTVKKFVECQEDSTTHTSSLTQQG